MFFLALGWQYIQKAFQFGLSGMNIHTKYESFA